MLDLEGTLDSAKSNPSSDKRGNWGPEKGSNQFQGNPQGREDNSSLPVMQTDCTKYFKY